MRSYWFGTQGKKLGELNPIQAYKEGMRQIEALSPVLELGMRNSLTLGRFQDWAEDILRQDATIVK